MEDAGWTVDLLSWGEGEEASLLGSWQELPGPLDRCCGGLAVWAAGVVTAAIRVQQPLGWLNLGRKTAVERVTRCRNFPHTSQMGWGEQEALGAPSGTGQVCPQLFAARSVGGAGTCTPVIQVFLVPTVPVGLQDPLSTPAFVLEARAPL